MCSYILTHFPYSQRSAERIPYSEVFGKCWRISQIKSYLDKPHYQCPQNNRIKKNYLIRNLLVKNNSQDQNRRVRVPTVASMLSSESSSLPDTAPIRRTLPRWDTPKFLEFIITKPNFVKLSMSNTILNKYMHCMDLANSRLCRSYADAKHLLAHFSVWYRERWSDFVVMRLDGPGLGKLTRDQLTHFFVQVQQNREALTTWGKNRSFGREVAGCNLPMKKKQKLSFSLP